jgi:hypothetical protein
MKRKRVGHFEREAKIMVYSVLLVVAAIVIAVILGNFVHG